MSISLYILLKCIKLCTFFKKMSEHLLFYLLADKGLKWNLYKNQLHSYRAIFIMKFCYVPYNMSFWHPHGCGILFHFQICLPYILLFRGSTLWRIPRVMKYLLGTVCNSHIYLCQLFLWLQLTLTWKTIFIFSKYSSLYKTPVASLWKEKA